MKIYSHTHTSNISGISASSGSLWKEHRTFALSTLRDFGFGKRSLQGKIMEEVEVFLQIIALKNDKAFNISDLIHTSVSNVICSVALGEHFEHEDETFKELTNALSVNLSNPVVTGLFAFLPFVRKIPGDPFNYRGFEANKDRVMGALRDILLEHKKHFNGTDVTNYLDAYLKYQKEHLNKDSTFTGKWTVQHVYYSNNENIFT